MVTHSASGGGPRSSRKGLGKGKTERSVGKGLGRGKDPSAASRRHSLPVEAGYASVPAFGSWRSSTSTNATSGGRASGSGATSRALTVPTERLSPAQLDRYQRKMARFLASMEDTDYWGLALPTDKPVDGEVLPLRDGRGNVKGYAALSDVGGRDLHVDLLYVARQGVGRGGLLLDAVEDYARRHGYDRLTLQSLPEAEDFYRRRGFEQPAFGGFVKNLARRSTRKRKRTSR